MELPKNITQIGESDRHCKIYVEDYVISYMKQLNQLALDKDMAVALFGIRKEENDVTYLFLYGACKLTFLQRETRHLSQAQHQEVEKLRKRYFQNYDFLGYRLLNGEMIEGMHVCEQDICRYITGYAQFYEKNDSMLAYMLDVREDVQPEVVDQEKYEAVKKKQEARRMQHEEEHAPKVTPQTTSRSLHGMRAAVVAVFAILCVIGLASIRGDGGVEELQAAARRVMNNAMEQQIPDAEDGIQQTAGTDLLVTEDKLAEAILRENEAASSQKEDTPDVAGVSNVEGEQNGNGTSETEEASDKTGLQDGNDGQGATGQTDETVAQGGNDGQSAVGMQNGNDGQSAVGTQNGNAAQDAQGTPDETGTQNAGNTDNNADASEVSAPAVQSYIIKEGDTLIGISLRNYGSDAKVEEICALNQISNPDDIKVGQKILLP